MQIRDQEFGKDASSSTSIPETVKSDEFKWLKIWQLKVPNKICMSIWRLAHNSLPVKRNMAGRGVKLDTICPFGNSRARPSGNSTTAQPACCSDWGRGRFGFGCWRRKRRRWRSAVVVLTVRGDTLRSRLGFEGWGISRN
jgi:hypothetical protein